MPFWILLVLLTAACDPCSGIANCGQARIRYEGDIVPVPGQSLDNFRVEFVRTDGVALDPPVVSGAVQPGGRFRLEARAAGPGTVIGDLLIYPGGEGVPDRFEEVRLETTEAEGNVRYLGSWRVLGLRFGAIGQLFYRATYAPAAGVEVEFRRVSGVPLQPDTFVVTTNADGVFPLRTQPLGAGEVVAELVVRSPPPYRSFTVPELRLRTNFMERPEPLVGLWGVGPHLPYLGHLVWADTRVSAADVEVEFRRTLGIPVQPESYVTRSNAAGHFALGAVVPLGYGELIGEVIVRPPAPYRSFTIPDIRLETTEDQVEDAILVGTWQIPRQ
jgi:hypothetical protein